MISNNSREKKLLKELEKNNSTSLKKFLITYCFICNEELLNNKISHSDIKFLLPDLKRVSYEYMLDNLNELYVGNIILTKDCYGHYAPYLNPKIKEYSDIDIVYKEEDKKDNFELAVDLQYLNIYELSELAKKYKQLKRMTKKKKICRMIKKKKDSDMKIYHKKKEKIMLKGRDENDKY